MEDANLKLEDSHEWVFNKAVAISRGVASRREYARKFEEIGVDYPHWMTPNYQMELSMLSYMSAKA